MHLTLVSQRTRRRPSGNVIAEVPGRDPKAPDPASSAAISTAGTRAPARSTTAPAVAITTAAAKHIMDAGRPLRTIRIVWFGAEEPGGFGGKAMPAAHGKEPLRDRRRKRFRRRPRVALQLAADEKRSGRSTLSSQPSLAPLGITRNDKGEADGTDVEPTITAGAPWVSLNQDGTRYFD